MARTSTLQLDRVARGVFRLRDTCNVYVLVNGRDAVAIDFGGGDVLERLPELGVERITDVLVTHHHRDQVQGLSRAVDLGARVWLPPIERDLVSRVDRHWLTRQVVNDYDVREDRFSLLEPVASAGCAAEYRVQTFGGYDVFTLPTPGHTIGSVSYIVEVDGRRIAFCGDLLYGPGKVWSLAATQWTYTGVEGLAATVLSCGTLADRAPDLLLPSHGHPIEEPAEALALTQQRLSELVTTRLAEPWDLSAWLRRPWVELTPHLLRNRTSFATTYALLSDSGAALLIDFGYDLSTGTPASSERASRRPLLTSLDTLRRDFAVERVDVVVPTHYHDDHVAGINLLRDVEGASVWAPENVAPILEAPSRFDLPCTWYDPIRVDRVLEHGAPTSWCEYELTTYALPGHTLYAAAISFTVDGRSVLAIGDQESFHDDGRVVANYQYRNRFRIDDYVRSSALYRRLEPDLFLTGHWAARDVDAGLLERVEEEARRVERLHRELLPLDEVDLGAEGFLARLEPYTVTVEPGEDVALDVSVRNPFPRVAVAEIRLVVPEGWWAEPGSQAVELEAHEHGRVRFVVQAAVEPVLRARVAADVTVDGERFGQHAEALVTVERSRG